MPYVNHAKQRKLKANSPEQQEAKRERRAKGAATYKLNNEAKNSGTRHFSLEQTVLKGTAKKPQVEVPKTKFKGAL